MRTQRRSPSAAEKKSFSSKWKIFWRGVQHEFPHHLVVAAVAASMLVILSHFGLLQWADSLMLRVAGSAHISHPAPSTATPINDLPAVYLIGDELYETSFNQTSPLDRNKIGKLIATITKGCPKVLAIDLDLAPGTRDTEEEIAAIFGALKQDQSLCKTPVNIVLATPIPVVSSAAAERNQKWMRDICQLKSGGRISFAKAEVQTSQGTVLRYLPHDHTLGVAAYLEATGAGANPICDANDFAVFTDALLQEALTSTGTESEAIQFAKQRLLNPHFFAAQTASTGTSPVSALLNGTDALPNLSSQPQALENKVVFLGASFGKGDKFLTAFGERDGVLLHAAAYFSSMHNVTGGRGKDHLLEFIVELCLGVVLGYLFHTTWAWAARAKLALRRANPSKWVVVYLWARAAPCANLMLLVGLVLGLVVTAALAYHRCSYWINPGPLVLGIFIKALIASHHEAAAVGLGTQPRGAIWADRVLAGSVVACALAIIVYHMNH